MTNDERKILEAELDKLSPTAQAILKKILTSAEIEILDENHQRFNGKFIPKARTDITATLHFCTATYGHTSTEKFLAVM